MRTGIPLDERDAIAEFWNWFRSHSTEIISFWRAGAATHLDTLMTARVRRIAPGIGWEIGPAAGGGVAFAFSPSGDMQRLQVTRGAVARAPRLEGWKFFAAKPPKQWDFRFEVFDAGEPKQIDASEWKYTLVAYNNRTFFDITLYTSGAIAQCSNSLRHEAGRILVEGILGEEFLIEYIGEIHIVTEIRQDVPSSGSIKVMKKHLESLRGSARQQKT